MQGKFTIWRAAQCMGANKCCPCSGRGVPKAESLVTLFVGKHVFLGIHAVITPLNLKYKVRQSCRCISAKVAGRLAVTSTRMAIFLRVEFNLELVP